MKILHTSDWHIGTMLYSRKRYEEFEKFFDWLLNTIKSKNIDVLLVSGDVFDTRTPSNRSQQIYYEFLCKVANSSCDHVVIIAGNHDSPSFINAPKKILGYLNIHVIGSVSEKIEDEVLILKNKSSKIELIVCAVPYLRDKDIRRAEAGESIDDKNSKIAKGVKAHYQRVCELAKKKRAELEIKVPIIAMGHLFAAGTHTIEGEKLRELYVGSQIRLGSDIFPDSIDYLALGHLHVSQKVNKKDNILYSGSPLPITFAEAKADKKVFTIEINNDQLKIKDIKVPCFKNLESIAGNKDEILLKINELKIKKSEAFCEIIYEGEEIIGNLSELVEEAVENSELEILKIENRKILNTILTNMENQETLDDLSEAQVFEYCLNANRVPIEQIKELKDAFNEILLLQHENDKHAE